MIPKQEGRYAIVVRHTENIGPRWDDDGNEISASEDRLVFLCCDTLAEVAEQVAIVNDLAADYGDGITSAKVMAIADTEDQWRMLPTHYKYWEEQAKEMEPHCALCNSTVTAFGPEDACGNEAEGWTHMSCARDQ